jgi:hypothetical protein
MDGRGACALSHFSQAYKDGCAQRGQNPLVERIDDTVAVFGCRYFCFLGDVVYLPLFSSSPTLWACMASSV